MDILKTCPVCSREFRKDEYEHNIQKHIESHSFTPPPRKSRKVVPNKQAKQAKDVRSYFKTAVKPTPAISTSSNVSVSEHSQADIIETESASEGGIVVDSESVVEGGVVEVQVESESPEVEVIHTSPPGTSHSNDFVKCSGVTLASPCGSNIYESFPFPLLQSKSFVFEQGHLHHSKVDYQIVQSTADSVIPINKACFDLKFSDSVNKIAKNMLDTEYYNSTANDEYLSHIQLKQRLDKIRKTATKLQLQNLNMSKKLMRLNKTLTLHERLLVLLKDGNIHRLKQLVGVAMKNKRNINYIVEKMVDAISGIYSPRPDQDDKDLSFVIWQIGGPALLEICHRAIGLPGTSTAYRMIKGKKFINSSFEATVMDAYNNITISETAPKYGHMIKIDETYIDSKIRWCPLDNKMYGFCYEHGRDEDLVLNDYEDVTHLADLVEEGTLHVAKECMVVVSTCNDVKETTQVLLAWSTCSRSEITIQKEFIEKYSKYFCEKNGAPLLCWATDGDAARRQIFDALMCFLLPATSKIYPIISPLKLIDMYVGANEETVDFDGKHLAKRTRNSMIASQVQIGGSVLTRKDISSILALAKTNSHTIEQLVNPVDKQNVSLATDFLVTFSAAVKSPQLESVGLRVAFIVPVLKLLGLVMEGVLALYCYVTSSVEEQLVCVSTAAHSFLVLRRVFGTVLPNQLYHDLQSTFQNVYFSAAKFQVYHPLLPFFIVLLGNDALERLFGNIHLKYGFNGLDVLELLYCTRAMKELLKIMSQHPEWTKNSDKVMNRICLDYSKPSSWHKEKLTMEGVNIKQCWDKRRLNMESFIQESKCDKLESVDFFDIVSSQNITMLKPNGCKLGLTELTADWSSEDFVVINADEDTSTAVDEVDEGNDDTSEHSEDDSEEIDESSSLIDVLEETNQDGTKHDPQLCINDVWFHKSTVLKQTFVGCRVSKDRLRRVQGMSKFVREKENRLDLDDVLIQGDAVLYLQKKTPKLGSVTKIHKAGKKVKMLNGVEIHAENVSLFVKELALDDIGTAFEWSGSHSNDSELKVPGKFCHTFQPELNVKEDKVTYSFDKSLMFDLAQYLGISVPGSQPSTSTTATSNDPALKQCFLCSSRIVLEKMKIHVGRHILNGNSEERYPCGYCGRGACQNKLGAPTRKNNELFYNKVESNCPYFVNVVRRVKKASSRFPCLNYLNKCALCQGDVWLYNIAHHYKDMHPGADVPTLNPEEVKLMTKK